MNYVSVRQAAALLGISEGCAYRLIQRGTLPVAMIAGRKCVRIDSVEALKADIGYQKRKRSAWGAPRKPRQGRLALP